MRVFILPERLAALTQLRSPTFLRAALRVLIGLPVADDHPERLPLLKLVAETGIAIAVNRVLSECHLNIDQIANRQPLFHVCTWVASCLFVLI